MSDTDGFIEEVTEAVRKDQLYGNLKKYGWIAGLIVVIAVGGAAYSEWSKSTATTEARARGDAISAALRQETVDAQVAALDALSTSSSDTSAIMVFQKAAILVGDGQNDAAFAALMAISKDENTSHVYREMALLKALIIGGSTMDQVERMASLNELAVAGGAFRQVAMEQIAVALLDAGDTSGALAQLNQLLVEPGITAELRQRALQLLVSLGGEIPAQTQLLSGN